MYSVQRASGIYVCIVYNVHQVCCMYSVQRASGIYVCIMYGKVGSVWPSGQSAGLVTKAVSALQTGFNRIQCEFTDPV